MFDLVQLGLIVLSVIALGSLLWAIKHGLLGHPEMWIMGNGSSHRVLRWFQDRSGTMFPEAWVFSVPLIVYRFAMLGWALWLAAEMIRWLRWGWGCFGHHGLWRSLDVWQRAKHRRRMTEEPLDLDIEDGSTGGGKDPVTDG